MVGLDYRTADLAVRSRAALALGSIPGAVVLSTCNRAEVYTADTDVESVIQTWGEEFRPYVTVREGDSATRHLFRVVSGLESAILGEAEIVAQVREAYRAARPGAALDLLFRRALETGKRVRSETDLASRTVSIGSLAVTEARARHGSLISAEILVLGAGQVAERVAKVLHAGGSRRVRIVNRSEERARALAESYGFAWGGLHELERVLPWSDVVIAAATAPKPLVTQYALNRAFDLRGSRRMTLVDLGVPPNVEAGAFGKVGLEALTDRSRRNGERRLAAVPLAEAIVEEEMERYALEVQRRHSRSLASRIPNLGCRLAC